MRIPEIAAQGAAILSTAAAVWLAIKKGLTLMQRTIPAILVVLNILLWAVGLAEIAFGGGTGDAKKVEVIKQIKAKIPALAPQLGLSSLIVMLMTNDALLGFLIDLAVDLLNKTGALKALADLGIIPAQEEATVPAAQGGQAMDPTSAPAAGISS
jgi:hypothetical protein